MIGILSAVEVLLMTSDTSTRRPLKFSARMTRSTVKVYVRASQLEARDFQMIEFRALPGIQGGVALLTGGGEAHRPMIRRCCVHVGGHMTADTVCGESLEPSDGGPLVTRIAFQSRVSADQRKSILMIADPIDRSCPTAHTVATFAAGAHVSAMDVGVAVAAFPSHIAEHRFQVALRTRNRLVHATKWVAGLVVIELGYLADRFPSAGGVAVLTGDVQRSVRAASSSR